MNNENELEIYEYEEAIADDAEHAAALYEPQSDYTGFDSPFMQNEYGGGGGLRYTGTPLYESDEGDAITNEFGDGGGQDDLEKFSDESTSPYTDVVDENKREQKKSTPQNAAQGQDGGQQKQKPPSKDITGIDEFIAFIDKCRRSKIPQVKMLYRRVNKMAREIIGKALAGVTMGLSMVVVHLLRDPIKTVATLVRRFMRVAADLAIKLVMSFGPIKAMVRQMQKLLDAAPQKQPGRGGLRLPRLRKKAA